MNATFDCLFNINNIFVIEFNARPNSKLSNVRPFTIRKDPTPPIVTPPPSQPVKPAKGGQARPPAPVAPPQAARPPPQPVVPQAQSRVTSRPTSSRFLE